MMQQSTGRRADTRNDGGRVRLTVRDLHRRFGETVALDSCSFDIKVGEIHALIGENGSGKSTLIKMLSGVMAPGRGEIDWHGKKCRLGSPMIAQRTGISTVFQETLVIEGLSVRDNVMLGLDRVVGRFGSPATEAALAIPVLGDLGLGTDYLDVPAGALTLPQRQLVTIARALVRSWQLLILDESTSALDVRDRDRLFVALDRFRKSGKSILFVSHRMDEIEKLADRVTVLRSGKSIATLDAHDASRDRLVSLMAPAESRPLARTRQNFERGPAVASTCIRASKVALNVDSPVFDLNISVGEIIGLAGLEGNGQGEFLECIAGLASPKRGQIVGRAGPITSTKSAALSKVAFLPRDRKKEGACLPLSIADNLALSALGQFSSFGILRRTSLDQMVDAMLRDLQVKVQSPKDAIHTLSGGNQQKVLFGRLLATRPSVLALNDPMRGVDLGAKREIYELLHKLSADGMTIVLLSTELQELCAICDRVAVFRDFGLAAIIEHVSLSEEGLIDAMFGHQPLVGADQ